MQMRWLNLKPAPPVGNHPDGSPARVAWNKRCAAHAAFEPSLPVAAPAPAPAPVAAGAAASPDVEMVKPAQAAGIDAMVKRKVAFIKEQGAKQKKVAAEEGSDDDEGGSAKKRSRGGTGVWECRHCGHDIKGSVTRVEAHFLKAPKTVGTNFCSGGDGTESKNRKAVFVKELSKRIRDIENLRAQDKSLGKRNLESAIAKEAQDGNKLCASAKQGRLQQTLSDMDLGGGGCLAGKPKEELDLKVCPNLAFPDSV